MVEMLFVYVVFEFICCIWFLVNRGGEREKERIIDWLPSLSIENNKNEFIEWVAGSL